MPQNSWITEGLVQFSESPLWRAPVDNFIDDNCCIFSTDPEMKLEYTTVHHQFRDLIDTLLTNCVQEIGVSMEDAVEALRSSVHHRSHDHNARTERHAAKKMLAQIFSADNFTTFYTMMVKRNLELDIMASASLAARGVDLGDGNTRALAGLEEQAGDTPARAQRAMDANGDMAEEEALRRAIEASLQDPQAEAQMRAYGEVCAQENVNMQVDDAEREAQHQRAQLEEALRDQAGSPQAEQYRKERLEVIDSQKNSQIQQIQNHTLSGPKQSFYHDKRRPTAEFSCPELPAMPISESSAAPVIIQAPDVVPAVFASAAAPPPPPPPSQQPKQQQQQQQQPLSAPVAMALPPIGHQQGALPSIAPKVAAGAPTTSAASGPVSATAATSTAAKTAAAAAGPSKTELEQRAQHMREQREMILARNRASRQQQLNTFVQQSQPAAAPSGNAAVATGAQKDLTVEIARRLRGDLVGEGRKNSA